MDRIKEHVKRARMEMSSPYRNPDICIHLAIVLADLEDLMREREKGLHDA